MTLVMFGAAWCAPCKKTRPVAEAVAAEAGTAFEYVDLEAGDPRAEDIRSVPTLRLYGADGALQRQHVGGASKAQVRALVAEGGTNA